MAHPESEPADYEANIEVSEEQMAFQAAARAQQQRSHFQTVEGGLTEEERRLMRLSMLPPGAVGRIIWAPEWATAAEKSKASLQAALANDRMSTGSGRPSVHDEAAFQAPYTHGHQR